MTAKTITLYLTDSFRTLEIKNAEKVYFVTSKNINKKA